MTSPDGSAAREPDPRVSLANERTYLAWTRTSLALLAGGVGVIRFAPADGLAWLRTTLAVVVTGLGMAAAAASYQRWRAVDRAVRAGTPLPTSVLLPVMAGVLVVVGVGITVLVLAG